MSNATQCKISVIPVSGLNSFNYDAAYNHILVLTEDNTEHATVKISGPKKLRADLNFLNKSYPVKYYVYLALTDEFKADQLLKEIKHFLNYPTAEIILLLPYLEPPTENSRTDNAVQSFMISKRVFDSTAFSLVDPVKFIYHTVNFYLNSSASKNIEIAQVGKPAPCFVSTKDEILSKLNNASVQITHKGPLRLLKRCLAHLNNTEVIPKEIEICFDDPSYKNLDLRMFKSIANKVTLYKNTPLGVGPFLARQYMAEQSNYQYIYLLDSDDIAVRSRFSKLMTELEKRNLDLLGSHELRIDQISKRLVIVRFPLDVNFALAKKSFHPMLHGTCIITKPGFLKAGGYSTEGKFGYDSQFLLRAFFFLKIGNIDDFLYLRFLRKHSLTTAKKTMHGTKLRKFMTWRWAVDFNLVYSGKLNLSDSTLRERKQNFRFKIVNVTKHNLGQKSVDKPDFIPKLSNKKGALWQKRSFKTERKNKSNSGIDIENQRKVYTFLSKTIYNELIEYGVDDEYIFPFLLHLHWIIVKKYGQVYKPRNIYNTEKVLRHMESSLETGKEAHKKDITDFIDAFFTDNAEILFSIYKDVYQTDTPPTWLKEWESLCESCYDISKFKMRTCLTLLRIANECLTVSSDTTEISLNTLLRIQKQHGTIM